MDRLYEQGTEAIRIGQYVRDDGEEGNTCATLAAGLGLLSLIAAGV